MFTWYESKNYVRLVMILLFLTDESVFIAADIGDIHVVGRGGDIFL
jgi:hypothetical protein